MFSFKLLYQRCFCMLIALAFSCLGVSNVFAQTNHLQMQKHSAETLVSEHKHAIDKKQKLMAEMLEHCSTHSPTASNKTTTPTSHHAGCLDCQLMHCQSLNYALAEPSVSLGLQYIQQEQENSILPDYTSQLLIGHWQQILRPPKA